MLGPMNQPLCLSTKYSRAPISDLRRVIIDPAHEEKIIFRLPPLFLKPCFGSARSEKNSSTVGLTCDGMESCYQL